MCGYYAPVVSRPFQLFVKPAGAACNLACRYCYYRGHAGESAAPVRMDDGLLETYVAQHLEASPSSEVLFSWHGGEPTLVGLEFFERVVALQARHERHGRRAVNGIQTNGVAVDDRWAAFFARHGFRVGLSLDGPADLHDRHRLNHGGQGSHAAALRAFECLSRHRVATEILCVVHADNVGQPLRVYRFLRKMGARAIGFLPVVRPDPGAPGGVTTESVRPDAYGRFLCEVFDEWAGRDEARIQVQMFDEALRPARGLEHGLCVFRPTCGDVPVLERNGDLYACDHFVDAAHRLGNLRDAGLESLLGHQALLAFGEAKRDVAPAPVSRLRSAADVQRRMPQGPLRAPRQWRARPQLPVSWLQDVLCARPAVGRSHGGGRARRRSQAPSHARPRERREAPSRRAQRPLSLRQREEVQEMLRVVLNLHPGRSRGTPAR